MAKNLALVLSGGGAKGAFQVGVLDFLNEKGVDFKIIAGVSTGALQAVMYAQGDIKALMQIWQDIRSAGDIYTERLIGLLGGFLGADSIYINGPLAEKIKKHVDPEKIRAGKRKLRIGVVSLQGGEFQVITEDSPNLAEWILASASIPVFFPPVNIGDEQFVDGGVRNITPLKAALDEKPDGCLVVLASSLKLEKQNKPLNGVVEIGLRALEIMTDEILREDIETAKWINDILEAGIVPKHRLFRGYRLVPIHVLGPKANLLDTLEFDPDKIRAAIEHGRKQAEKEWPKIQETLGI